MHATASLVPAWSRSSLEPREVCLAVNSPPLTSLPGDAAPEEVLRRLPREAWPLARVLIALLMKMGRTGPLVEPRRGPQAGKSWDPRSQNADTLDLNTKFSSIFLENYSM